MSPINARHGFDPSDRINIIGLALTVGIGIAALVVAYATYQLQRRPHRWRTQLDDLEAQGTALQPLQARSRPRSGGLPHHSQVLRAESQLEAPQQRDGRRCSV